MRNWFVLLVAGSSLSSVAAEMTKEGGDKGLYAIAAALAITIAGAGGALGQGKIGASAMEGLARNPQAQKNMFTSMILGLAFIESIVIYALVVSILILTKF